MACYGMPYDMIGVCVIEYHIMSYQNIMYYQVIFFASDKTLALTHEVYAKKLQQLLCTEKAATTAQAPCTRRQKASHHKPLTSRKVRPGESPISPLTTLHHSLHAGCSAYHR